MGINVLSLFDGMSCGQIALKRAGIDVNHYFASEIDKYAIEVTQKNFPKTIQLGDVMRWKEWEMPKIDLIIGGSPCQGFSRAGKGLNFDDPRSKLFFEFVKIVSFHKPYFFLLENVVMKKEWQSIISEYLKVDPIRINSSLVSAQNRDRLYWTNIPGVEQPEDKGVLVKHILLDKTDGRYLLDDIWQKHWKENCQWIHKKSRSNQGSGLIQIGSLYKNNGDAGRIYSIDGKARTLKGEAGGGGAKMGLYYDNDKVRRLTPIECERLQTVPDNYSDGVSDAQRYKLLGNGWTVDVIAHIFGYLPMRIDAVSSFSKIKIDNNVKS